MVNERDEWVSAMVRAALRRIGHAHQVIWELKSKPRAGHQFGEDDLSTLRAARDDLQEAISTIGAIISQTGEW